MSTLRDAKRYYHNFFIEDKFNMDKTLVYFERFSDKDIRAKYIKRIYDFLFDISNCSEITKLWIKNPNSILDTIKEYNRKKRGNNKVKESSANARVSYDINRYNKLLTIKYNDRDYSIFEILNFNGDFDLEYKKLCDKVLESVQVGYSEKEYTNKDLLINIPAKALSIECDNEKFREFLKIIEPYSVKLRRNLQDKINLMTNEVGYFNYIMSKGAELTSEEKELKGIILDWLNGFDFDLNNIESSVKENIEEASIKNDNVEENIEETSIESEEDKKIKELQSIIESKEKEIERLHIIIGDKDDIIEEMTNDLDISKSKEISDIDHNKIELANELIDATDIRVKGDFNEFDKRIKELLRKVINERHLYN